MLLQLRVKNLEETQAAHQHLKAFREAFTRRYEERQMPLLEVLDNVSGIGYLQDHRELNSFSELIDDLKLPAHPKASETVYSESKRDALLTHFSLKALKNQQTYLDLKQEDLGIWEAPSPAPTGTFSVLYNKIGDQLCLQAAGGTTAAQYIGRFSCNDVEMSAMAQEIANAEAQLFQDRIPAEILHPTSSNRAGNVSIRNLSRKYEIPIPDQASGKALTQHKREVISFLSCAHNFHRNALPAYQSLCDLQVQYRPNTLSLNTHDFLFKHFFFIPPPPMGESLILSPALWRFKKEACKSFLDERGNIQMQAFQRFKVENQIPRYLCVDETGSDPLVVDTENEFMLQLLSDILKKQGAIQFYECYYDFSSTAQPLCQRTHRLFQSRSLPTEETHSPP